jgi:hypothetical protein
LTGQKLEKNASMCSAIKWPDNRMPPSKHQPPKAKLMPSFTRKSLEFHNCPEAEASPIIKRRTKGKVLHYLQARHSWLDEIQSMVKVLKNLGCDIQFSLQKCDQMR